MMEDLRRFSRVRRTGAYEPVDLGKIVRETLDEMRPLLEETKASVEVKALPVVSGDAFQIKQLFLNLLGNAVKFRNAARPLRIEVGEEKGLAGFHEIHVKDNGIGFEPKYADQIFVPFKRLHTQFEYQGTGIGLAICRKVALLHGGNIFAQSVPGEGTEFTVAFPRSASS
jgi:signal transduction histidine kinase